MNKLLKNIDNFNPLRGGFTLIELAIVLTLVSLIIGGGLSYSIAARELKRYELTESKIDFIMKAIDAFVDENGYIPCPADPRLSFGSDAFGFGSFTLSASDPKVTATTCNAGNIIDSGVANVMYGAVPVYSLNIPPDYIYDGWNRRFTYIVDQELTHGDATGYGDLTITGDIEVRSPGYDAGVGKLAQPITYRHANAVDVTALEAKCDVGGGNAARGDCIKIGAAVALISHGGNGFGAYGGAGGGAAPAGKFDPAGGSADEDENADHLVTADEIIIQSLQRGDFDDLVEYRMRWQLDISID